MIKKIMNRGPNIQFKRSLTIIVIKGVVQSKHYGIKCFWFVFWCSLILFIAFISELEASRKSPDNSVDDIDSMDLIEHEKSVDDEEDCDSNVLYGNIREIIESSLLMITETERENSDEEQDPESLRNEKDRVVEELVSKIKSLLAKVIIIDFLLSKRFFD